MPSWAITSKASRIVRAEVLAGPHVLRWRRHSAVAYPDRRSIIVNALNAQRDAAMVGEPQAALGTANTRELRRAQAVQRAMLPQLPDIFGLSIAAHYEPAGAVGGDFYDVFVAGNYRLALLVGDVSGHGVDAAILMAAAKKALQLVGLGCGSPKVALQAAARAIATDIPRGMFVSILYVVIDLKAQSLTVSGGGQPALKLINPRRPERSLDIRPGGVVMGALSPDEYASRLTEETIALQPDDLIVLHTDGVTESPDCDGHQLGESGVRALLEELKELSPVQLLPRLAAHLAENRGGAQPGDDLTVLALRFNERARDTRRIRLGAGAAAEPPFPPAVGELLGRETSQTELLALLREPGNRCVSVVGTGGIGKTHLVLHTLPLVAQDYPGGVFHFDAEGDSSLRELASRIATKLGVAQPDEVDTFERLGHALAARPRSLVVVDTAEHLLASILPVIDQWLAVAPNLTILICSRLPVGPKARQLNLGPLSTSSQDSTTPAAVKLFIGAMPCSTGSPVDTGAVAELCRHLDGNPLLLRLAAGRCGLLSPSELLGRLQKDSAGVELVSPAGDRRHRSARASLEWTLSLLREADVAALRTLAALPDTFTIAHVEVLLAGLPGLQPLEALETLVASSLVEVIDSAHSRRMRARREVRLGLGTSVTLSDGAAERFIEFLASWSEQALQRLRSLEAAQVIRQLENERTNLDWALRFCLERAGTPLWRRRAAQLGIMMRALWERADPKGAQIPLLQQLAVAFGDEVSDYAARVHMTLATALGASGRSDQSVHAAGRAVGIARALGDRHLLVSVLNQFGHQNRAAGDRPAALKCHEEALGLAQALFDAIGEANAEHGIGLYYWEAREPELAIQHLEIARRMYEDIGAPQQVLSAIGNLSNAYRDLRDTKAASALLAEASEIVRELDDQRGLVRIKAGQAALYYDEGDFRLALESYRDAMAAARLTGDAVATAILSSNTARVCLDMGLPDEALAAARDAKHFGQRVRRTPSMALGLVQEGRAFLQKADPHSALRAFSEADRVFAGTPSEQRRRALALIGKAHALYATQQHAAALQACLESDVLEVHTHGEWLVLERTLIRALASAALGHQDSLALCAQAREAVQNAKLANLAESAVIKNILALEAELPPVNE